MKPSHSQRIEFQQAEHQRYQIAQGAKLRLLGDCLANLSSPVDLPVVMSPFDKLTLAELGIQQAATSTGELSQSWFADATSRFDELDGFQLSDKFCNGDSIVTLAAAKFYKPQLPILRALHVEKAMPSALELARSHAQLLAVSSALSKRSSNEHTNNYVAGNWLAIGSIATKLAIILIAQRYSLDKQLHDSWVPVPATLLETVPNTHIGQAPRASWDVSIWTDKGDGPEVGHRLHIKTKSTTTPYVRDVIKISTDHDLANDHARQGITSWMLKDLLGEQKDYAQGDTDSSRTKRLNRQTEQMLQVLESGEAQ